MLFALILLIGSVHADRFRVCASNVPQYANSYYITFPRNECVERAPLGYFKFTQVSNVTRFESYTNDSTCTYPVYAIEVNRETMDCFSIVPPHNDQSLLISHPHLFMEASVVAGGLIIVLLCCVSVICVLVAIIFGVRNRRRRHRHIRNAHIQGYGAYHHPVKAEVHSDGIPPIVPHGSNDL